MTFCNEGLLTQRRPLIAFEGIDGTGKTTLVRHVQAELTQRGICCQAMLNAGERPGILGRIQAIIDEMTDDSSPYDPRSRSLLAFAYFSYLTHAFAKNEWDQSILLVDRYVHSIIAYSTFDGVDAKWLSDVASILPMPDGVVFLDSGSRSGFDSGEGALARDILKGIEAMYRLFLLEEPRLVSRVLALAAHSDLVSMVQETSAFILRVVNELGDT